MQTRPPIDAVEDWALARLARPICAGRHLLLHPLPPAEIFRLSAERRVYQIAYHRDRPGWHAAYSGPCHFGRDFPESEWSRTAAEFKRPQDVLLHTCDTGEASSGSPIIAETAMGPVVVALNVGTYVQPRVGTAPGQVREVIIANTAILITPLVRALPLLQRAELLRTGSELRGLQAHLAALGHYHGRLDGDYGPLLRTAIRAFERSRGSEPTGLATRALLAELELEAAERHRATAGSWDRRTTMPPPAEMPASERLRLFAPPLQPAFPPR